MKYDIEELKIAVAKELGVPENGVEVVDVKKGNGIHKTGIRIVAEGADAGAIMCPIVYPEDLNMGFMDGDITKAAGVIAEIIRKNTKKVANFPFNRDTVMKKCKVRVIPVGKNFDILGEYPHRITMDFAEIVYVECDDLVKDGVAKVSYKMLEGYGIDEDELFEAAHRNTKADGFECMGMSQILGPLAGGPGEDILFVVTNEKRLFGASALAFPELIAEYQKQIGSDTYILPSSLHEILLVKKEAGEAAMELAGVVAEINKTQVADEDVLTDSVYELVDGRIVKVA